MRKEVRESKRSGAILTRNTAPNQRDIIRAFLVKGLVLSLFPLLFLTPSVCAAKAIFVRLIVVATRPEAEDLLSRVRKGEAFSVLAREKSVDEKSRIRYGEIEAGEIGGLDQRLRKILPHLGEGENSGIVETAEGKYAILHVVDLNFYRKGAKAFRAGDFRAAEMNLLKYITANPDAVKARLMLGRIYQTQKAPDRAEAAYREALKFAPNSEEALSGLAAVSAKPRDGRGVKDGSAEGLSDPKAVKHPMEREVEIAALEPGKKKEKIQEPDFTEKDLPIVVSGKNQVVSGGSARQEPKTNAAVAKPLEIQISKVEPVPDRATGNTPKVADTPVKNPSTNETEPTTAAAKRPKVQIPKIEPVPDRATGNTPKGGDTPVDSSLPKKPVPGKTVYLRILLTSNLTDAKEVLAELKKGKSFAVLAKEKSIDQKSKEEYGYLGEVDTNSLNPSIQKELSSMKEGQTSGIIPVDQDRYALVQVTNITSLNRAEKALLSGDIARAEKLLSSYVELNPDSIKARAMLGKIYEERKEFAKAIDMYKKAISFNPKVVLLYERLARIYLYLGEYQKARSVYLEGSKQVPFSPVFDEGIEMSNILMLGQGEAAP